MKKKSKLIRISEDTDEAIKDLGKFGESYDKAIKKLLKKGK